MRFLFRIITIIIAASLIPITPTYAQAKQFREKGVAVLVFGRDTKIFEKRIDEILLKIVSMGGTSVSFNIPLHVDTWQGNKVFPSPIVTPTDQQIGYLVRKAHDYKLTVLLKTGLGEENPPKENNPFWSGNMQPQDRDIWFKNYTDVLVRYAKLAQKYQIEYFGIGSEMTSMEEDPRWVPFISQVRKYYKGRIVYSFNHDSPFRASFIDLIDVIAINAYVPFYALSADRIPEVKEFIFEWKRYFTTIQSLARHNKEIFITEVGIRPIMGAYREPWNWSTAKGISFEMQRRYYQAVCLAFKEHQIIQGVYWWALDFTGFPENPLTDTTFNPVGKPAEQEVATCYK